MRETQRRQNFKPKRRTEDSSQIPKCFECNQPGHMRSNCPIFKRKIEKSEKKTIGDKKAKKAYITWDDNDLESSDDSKKEVINLCLMGKSYESNEEVTSSNKSISFGLIFINVGNAMYALLLLNGFFSFFLSPPCCFFYASQ